MNLAPRTILILTLLLGAAERLTAQEATSTATAAQETAAVTTTATTTATTTTTDDVSDEARETEAQPTASERNERAILRDRFTALLGQHPDSLSKLLYLDPSLLSNDAFLAKYPDLAQFVAENPDIRRNPHYFVRV